MIEEGRVYVAFGSYGTAALDTRRERSSGSAATSRNHWRGPGSSPILHGDQKKGFATPVVIEASGQAQLISPAAKAVLSLDPLTGRELWRVRYPQHSAAARPPFAHGLVYVASGRGKAELFAIRPEGQGDVTETHVAWKAFRGIGASPSPLLVGGYVYAVSDKAGVVTCLNAKTGAEVWQRRVGGGAHMASPLMATPAIAGQAIVLRTEAHLYRLERKP